MTTRYFLRATTTNPNTNDVIRDLLDTQGGDGAIAASENADNTFLTTARWRTPILGTELDPQVPTSLRITDQTGSNIFRWRVNRLDAGGAIVASSSWSAEFTTTGVHTHVFADAPAGTYDQMELEFQSARDGGMPSGNSVTIAVSDPDSTVDLTAAVAGPAEGSGFITATGSLTGDGEGGEPPPGSGSWFFDGVGDYLESPDSASFRSLTSEGSWWLWHRPSGVHDDEGAMISKTRPQVFPEYTSWALSGGVEASVGADVSYEGHIRQTAKRPLSVDQWYFILGTYDSSLANGIRLRVWDAAGVLIEDVTRDTPDAADIAYSDEPFRVGRNQVDRHAYRGGHYAFVGAHNAVLTEAQIDELLATGVAPFTPSAVDLRLDSDTATDVAQGNPFTVFGAVYDPDQSPPVESGDPEGSGSITATGSLTASGEAPASGSGSITGEGSLEGDGFAPVIPMASGSGSITATGSLEGDGFAPEVTMAEGSGSIAATGSLTASGQVTASGAGAITATGSLTGDGFAPVVPMASGSGFIAAVGSLEAEGHALASGSGSITATGSLEGAGPGGRTVFRLHGEVPRPALAGSVPSVTLTGEVPATSATGGPR